MEDIKANANRPSSMVIDMRKDLGMMVQLITPRAKLIHNMLIESAKRWDGETDLFRKLG